MNDDPFRDLEQQLAGLQPARLPRALTQRIVDQLADAPLTLSDRILATFMAGGALAASFIITLIILSAATAPPPAPAPNRAEAAARQQMLRDYQSLLAQR